MKRKLGHMFDTDMIIANFLVVVIVFSALTIS